MSNLLAVTTENFAEEVLEAEGLVLSDFWASWCQPCRHMAPILDELATERGRELKFTSLDVDAAPSIAADYRVSSIPTLAFFFKGKLVATLVGARPKEVVSKEIDRVLSQVSSAVR